MTKSEARAIEQRAGKAYRMLEGIQDRPVDDDEKSPPMPYSEVSMEMKQKVFACLKAAQREIKAVYEMATAELETR